MFPSSSTIVQSSRGDLTGDGAGDVADVRRIPGDGHGVRGRDRICSAAPTRSTAQQMVADSHETAYSTVVPSILVTVAGVAGVVRIEHDEVAAFDRPRRMIDDEGHEIPIEAGGAVDRERRRHGGRSGVEHDGVAVVLHGDALGRRRARDRADVRGRRSERERLRRRRGGRIEDQRVAVEAGGDALGRRRARDRVWCLPRRDRNRVGSRRRRRVEADRLAGAIDGNALRRRAGRRSPSTRRPPVVST